MSIQVPLRLKVEANGTLKGYAETLNFKGGTVAFNGPVAEVTVGSGGGGGDADTLQGHPASYFATEVGLTTVEGSVTTLSAQVAAILQRALMWANLGIAVQASSPGSGITYAQWVGGASGFWGWIKLP